VTSLPGGTPSHRWQDRVGDVRERSGRTRTQREARAITTRGYHHGNLRRAIIDAAVEAIAESGTATWSLRELARRAGVSHAAPAHHFGDKAGLFTAIAAEGYERLTETLSRAGDDFLEAGVAYVRFATENPGYFEVMFRPGLYRPDDPEVVRAEEAAAGILRGGAGTISTDPSRNAAAAVGAWSVVHGFAQLWLSGNLSADFRGRPDEAARTVLHALFDNQAPSGEE
jgi:AcrR family transcriptional regulator